MDRAEFIARYVPVRYRPYRGQTYQQYLRDKWPELADIYLIQDPGRRKVELAEVADMERHARSTYALCTGAAWPITEDMVETFLESLRRAGDPPASSARGDDPGFGDHDIEREEGRDE